MTKVCTACKVDQPIDQFTIDRKMKTGRKNQCRSCINKKDREARSGKGRAAHTQLSPAKQMRAAVNRNALLRLIQRHPDEFDMLVKQEMVRLKAMNKDPEAKKTWISSGELV